MTENRPDPSRDPLPDRLAGWFDREVRQAAADLRAEPLGSARVARRASGPAIAPLAAVAVVVIAVVAGLTRLPGFAPGVEPSASSSPGTSVSGAPKSTSPTPTASIPALTVDSRYPDGIPSSLGGRYVARPSNIGREPANDQPFLLGGWSFDFTKIAYACTLQLVPAPSFGPRCGTPFLAENPLTDQLPRVMLDGWTAAIPAGPVVLEVHRHDSRAALCSPERREGCENMAVIGKLVWAGDSTTATAPREPTDTFMRLIEADASLPQATISALPSRSPIVIAPGLPILPAVPSPSYVERTCEAPLPTEAWSVEGAMIEQVLVFSTIAARELVDQNFTASGFIGTTADGGICQMGTDSFFSRKWIAVDNVMVAVRVTANGTTAAQLKLIDEVRAALTH